jgi:hypothetical protein
MLTVVENNVPACVFGHSTSVAPDERAESTAVPEDVDCIDAVLSRIKGWKSSKLSALVEFFKTNWASRLRLVSSCTR